MKTNIQIRPWILMLVMFMSALSGFSQTPTTDLTAFEPSGQGPAGATFEWRTGPTSSDPILGNPTAVLPGLYYGFYNYGASCYSRPSPIRVLTNECASITVDLTTAVEFAPIGAELSYHSSSPASSANEITGTAITQAVPGTYFVAFRTIVNGDSCYSQTSPIVVVATPCVDLAVVKEVDNPTPFIGEDIVFTVKVYNLGSSNEPAATLEDVLPAGFTYVSSTASVGSYNATTGIWNIGALNAGDSAILEMTVTVTTIDDYTNIASVTGSIIDYDSTNNVATNTPEPVFANSTYAVNDQASTYANIPVSSNVMVNDFDLEGDNQIFNSFLGTNGSAITSGTVLSGVDVNGSPVANAGTLVFAANGNFTFNPASNFVGQVSVPYSVCDDAVLTACDTAILDIVVLPMATEANSVVANNDEYFILQGEELASNLLVNDTDPQGDNFLVTGIVFDSNGDGTPDSPGSLNSPLNIGGVDLIGTPVANAGVFTLLPNGNFTFVPEDNFVGQVTLSYEICDDGAPIACSNAMVTIDVIPNKNGPLNDPPVAGDDFVSTSINAAVNGNFSGNDYDLNGDPISINGVTIIPNGPRTQVQTLTTAQGGSITLFSDGTYTYFPPLNYVGPDRVEYEICDVTIIQPQPLCAQATIHMLVGNGIEINGAVWQDADGSVTINNGELGTTANTDLYVNVVDALGRVVGVTKVNADGTYTLDSVPAAQNLSLVLSLTEGVIGQLAPVASLPAEWANTGQNFNGAISTGILGVLPFFSGTDTLFNLDFGIELKPTAEDFVVNTIYYVNVDSQIQNPLEVLSQYFITDDEDGTVDFIRLIAFPANVLSFTINGVTYSDSNFPVNGITLPADANGQPIGTLSVIPDYPDFSTVIIPFIPVDNAGVDGNLASVTITFSAILPVELVSFDAVKNGCIVDLNWLTASEFNNDFFAVYRSLDAVNWVAIGKVAGNGSTPLPTTYSFTDVAPQATLLYYRLLQRDFDGEEEWLPVVSVDMSSCQVDVGIRIYPNPAKSVVRIEIPYAGNEDRQLIIFNSAGAVMKEIDLTGQPQKDVAVQSLPAGMYIFSIMDARGVINEKIEILR